MWKRFNFDQKKERLDDKSILFNRSYLSARANILKYFFFLSKHNIWTNSIWWSQRLLSGSVQLVYTVSHVIYIVSWIFNAILNNNNSCTDFPTSIVNLNIILRIWAQRKAQARLKRWFTSFEYSNVNIFGIINKSKMIINIIQQIIRAKQFNTIGRETWNTSIDNGSDQIQLISLFWCIKFQTWKKFNDLSKFLVIFFYFIRLGQLDFPSKNK